MGGSIVQLGVVIVVGGNVVFEGGFVLIVVGLKVTLEEVVLGTGTVVVSVVSESNGLAFVHGLCGHLDI